MANSHARAINIEEADCLYPSREKKQEKEKLWSELKGELFLLLFQAVCCCLQVGFFSATVLHEKIRKKQPALLELNTQVICFVDLSCRIFPWALLINKGVLLMEISSIRGLSELVSGNVLLIIHDYLKMYKILLHNLWFWHIATKTWWNGRTTESQKTVESFLIPCMYIVWLLVINKLELSGLRNFSLVIWAFLQGMEDPRFINQWHMNSLDELSILQPAATTFGENLQHCFMTHPNFNIKNSMGTSQTGIDGATKKLKVNSWDSSKLDHVSYPQLASSDPNINLSFADANYTNHMGILKPKEEVVCSQIMNTLPSCQGGKRNISTSSRLSQAQDHIMAERKRREKLSQRFIALSAIVPGLKKV